jgi:AhpD family alkylhydroperoxidase
MRILSKDDLFSDIRQALGLSFTPTIFQYISDDLNRLNQLWVDTRANLLEGNLPRLLKDMIFVVVARSRNCQYCTTAHMAFCKMLGLNKSDLDLLLNDISKLQPDNVRLSLEYAVSLLDTHSSAHLTHQQQLIDLGMSDDDVNEIILMVGFACNMTILTKGFGLSTTAEDAFVDILHS